MLPEIKTIYKRLRRDGTEVMRVCLSYPAFFENFQSPENAETPAIKKLNMFFEKIAQAYLRYAESRVPLAKHGSSVLLSSKAGCENGYISVYFNIIEYEGTDRRPKLVNYRRFSYIWDRAGGYLIPPEKILKQPHQKTAKRSPAKYDGYYLDGGNIYGFINHYRKGKEAGKRRSEYKRFIAEEYIGMLSDC